MIGTNGSPGVFGRVERIKYSTLQLAKEAGGMGP